VINQGLILALSENFLLPDLNFATLLTGQGRFAVRLILKAAISDRDSVVSFSANALFRRIAKEKQPSHLLAPADQKVMISFSWDSSRFHSGHGHYSESIG
jgi:hypothetical protein